MSLFSDSESSNSSSDVVFGSLAVQPNSPTPYTDATQVTLYSELSESELINVNKRDSYLVDLIF